METSPSQTIHELNDIPLVRSVVGVYSKTKGANVVFTFGFSAAEKGFGFVFDKILDTTGCGTTADFFVGNFLSNLKDSYPLLQKPPEKIYRKTKQRTTKFIERRIRSALRSSVGQVFVSGVDSVTERTNKACRRLRRDTRDRKSSKSDRHVQLEIMSPTKTSRGQQTKLTGADDRWVKKLTREEERQVQPVFSLSYVLLLPLEFVLSLLRAFQRKVHALAGISKERRKSSRLRTEQTSLSPEKVEEIEARRKVSPRKRLNSSIFRGIKTAAFRVLGFQDSNVKQTDIRQFLSCSKHKSLNTCPVNSGEDAEKKRKHDDILSDSDASSDDEDLVNMDLKNYISDEDPDYEPTDDSDSDVSIDSEDEEEESDFETVESDGLVRIKDKENTHPKDTKKDKERKPEEAHKPENTLEDPVRIENVNKNKENKARSSPKKAVLSPRKQPNTNIQPVVILNKSPLKQLGGKDEKKDASQKPTDPAKPPDTGNKSQPQNLGGSEKPGNQDKQGQKKC